MNKSPYILPGKSNAPNIGKEVNRQREIEFYFKSIFEFRIASMLDLATGEDTMMDIWHYACTLKESGSELPTGICPKMEAWKAGKSYRSIFFMAINRGEIGRKD